MTPKQFDREARDAFSGVLSSEGFESSASKHCTFYRQVTDDLWHLIVPDIGSRGVWYDVKVFATSSRIEPLFSERFPDELGVPADVCCYLDPTHGVGPRQYQYRCRTVEGFQRGFASLVRPALAEHALPYLEGITGLEALVPHIHNNLDLGFALYETGQADAAAALLQGERARLLAAREDRLVEATLAKIDAILASPGGARDADTVTRG